MRIAQGGSQMYCHTCGEVQVCEAIPTTVAGKPSDQRWYRKDHRDIQWFRRSRKCTYCYTRFTTAEISERFLDGLVELRNALANIKPNAEEFVKHSKGAAESLSTLTASLDVLRALKLYMES